MIISEKNLQRALELHQTFPVADAHMDLAGEILLRHQAGEENVLRRLHMKDFRRAGLNLLVSSIFIEDDKLPEQGLRNALEQIAIIRREIETLNDAMLVETKADLQRAVEENKVGILLYMEGLECIGTDELLLDILWQCGIRGAALVWSRRSMLATGAPRVQSGQPMPAGGLSEQGISIVRYMEEKGMFLDVSHLNDDGIAQIEQIAQKPYIATHSNARQITPCLRNLTDAQMKVIADKGGMIGLNANKYFSGFDKGGDPMDAMAAQIRYMIEQVGVSHVGYGFDLIDSYERALPRLKQDIVLSDAFSEYSQIPVLTAYLLESGMAEEDLTALIGGNWIRYFMQVLPD